MPGLTRRDFLNATLIGSGTALLTGATPADLAAQAARAAAPGRAAFDGYGGIGDYAHANGNTFDVLSEGHKIRDRVYDRVPARDIADAGTFDLVIVGGGISGLAAALFFQRESGAAGAAGATIAAGAAVTGTAAKAGARNCLVLDDHAIFGGLARANEFSVGGEHLIGNQASAMFFPPLPGTFLAEFYPSIGLERATFDYQRWDTSPRRNRLDSSRAGAQGRTDASGTRELPVGRTPYFGGGPTSAFYFGPRFGKSPGELLIDPWGTRLAHAPIPEEAKRDLLKMRDTSGVRQRAQPKQHGDEAARRLDAMTLEQHIMEAYGIGRDTVRTFLSPVTGGGSGLGADALSAYADYAADVLLPWDYAQGSQMLPGGNAGVARHIVKCLIPDAFPGPNRPETIARARVDLAALDRRTQPPVGGVATRIRQGCTVISVAHDGPPDRASDVSIVYARGGRLHRVRARAVIMANGSWTTRHIVKDLPQAHREAYAQFHRSPCLLANVAVRHWRFMADLGIHECRWFEGIGNSCTVRRTATFGPVADTMGPDRPTVLTFKILFTYPGEPLAAQVTRGRAELLSTPFRDYERQLTDQLAAMFGRHGFDARRDVAGIVLNRWGHAYLSPQPGFFFGTDGQPAPGDLLRERPVGRIAFANSDVTGIMDHRASILEARRAVSQVVKG